MEYDFKNVNVPKAFTDASLKKLRPVIKQASEASFGNEYASLAVLDDFDLINRAGALAKHMKDVDLLVLVGIGGSNLGTLAVAEATLGKHYQSTNTPRILYADTVDASYTQEILREIQHAIDAKKNIVVNVVSKSGTTTETVALFTIIIDLMRKKEGYRDSIVVTSDRGSALWHAAQTEGYHMLEIPKMVGGRYSVFSPVGLFPLMVLGIDIQELVKGAVYARSYCLKDGKQNPAALSAICLAHAIKRKLSVHDTFLFSQQLEGVGKWYRQLLAESIGKEKNTKGRIVHAGITPTVSIGSVDLHSMGQLYIDGNSHSITTFVTITKQPMMMVPLNKSFAMLVNNVQNKTLQQLMDAIAQGTMTTYAKQKKPFAHIILPDTTERTIGELLQMKMLEVIYLAALLNVNPFDQPAVEKYKTETRKILSQ